MHSEMLTAVAAKKLCRSGQTAAPFLNVYKEAKRLGLSVDHIVPLHNPMVCGLHVPWNLQLLPLEDNIRKGNKHAC
jgi:hypothetical protein